MLCNILKNSKRIKEYRKGGREWDELSSSVTIKQEKRIAVVNQIKTYTWIHHIPSSNPRTMLSVQISNNCDSFLFAVY